MPSLRGAPLVLVSSLVLTAACGEKTGDFEASLSGPLEGTIRGGARFCEEASGAFRLILSDPDHGAGFVLHREAGVAPGSYGVVGTDTLSTGAFRAVPQLQALDGGEEYRYRVRGGGVRITAADSAWIRGRFELDMVASDADVAVDTLTRAVRRLPTEEARAMGRFTAARSEACPSPETPS